MTRYIPGILLSLSMLFPVHGQYKAAEMERISINPETGRTTFYFMGTDHPDVNFYYIMEYDYQSENAPLPSGEPIPASYTEDVGDPDFLYEVTLDLPEVHERSVGYYIRPYQDINTPLTDYSGDIDSTVFLSVDLNECLNRAELSWNDYNGWRNNILRYRVMVKIDEADPIILADLNEGQTTYTATGLQGGMNYLFFIHTRRTDLDPDQYVLSNGVSAGIETLYPDYIHADYGTVGANNAPEVQFSIGSETDIDTWALLRAPQWQGSWDTLTYINSNEFTIRYTDTEADAAVQPWYYKLVGINFCNNPVRESENPAGTVYLEGSLQGTSVSLDWTAYHEWNQGVSAYSLERYFEGEMPESVTGLTGLNYTDDLSGFNTSEHASRVCYQVTASENPGDPHSSVPASSTSNLFCINLPLHIAFTFDAFTPGAGANNTYGPTMDFLPSWFDFRIYNRNGTIVFHSTDPLNHPRWDGYLPNGTLAPQGVYRCTLKYEDETGNKVVLQERVTLIR